MNDIQRIMKILKTEELVVKEISIPQITGIFDPLSGRNDGTITPQAPVVVWGRNLEMDVPGETRLCLASAVDFIRVIEFPSVYKRTSGQTILLLPYLEPGEYFPAILINAGAEGNSIYILPVSWVVLPS